MKKLMSASAVVVSLLASALVGFSGAATAEAATAKAPVSTRSWSTPVVYVYDMTSKIDKADGSPVWPVHAAAERWDNGNPIDFRYTTKGCPVDSQCVTVKQQELAAPAVGVTSTAFVGSDIKASTIVLDKTFGRTNSAARRRNVICHELGHSLGLEHRTAKTSCLTSYATAEKFPDATDIKNLNTMYQGK
jgi:hypothetical protein